MDLEALQSNFDSLARYILPWKRFSDRNRLLRHLEELNACPCAHAFLDSLTDHNCDSNDPKSLKGTSLDMASLLLERVLTPRQSYWMSEPARHCFEEGRLAALWNRLCTGWQIPTHIAATIFQVLSYEGFDFMPIFAETLAFLQLHR